MPTEVDLIKKSCPQNHIWGSIPMWIEYSWKRRNQNRPTRAIFGGAKFIADNEKGSDLLEPLQGIHPRLPGGIC